MTPQEPRSAVLITGVEGIPDARRARGTLGLVPYFPERNGSSCTSGLAPVPPVGGDRNVGVSDPFAQPPDRGLVTDPALTGADTRV